jgi:hypothetical protein
MDCEKFESAMLGELYGDLDELTSAAAKRHLAGCARCSARLDGLRATRRVAAVPLVEPPSDLDERILRAVERASVAPPRRPGLAEMISLAGSWAMRPQTAMAAVFLVMIGTSLLLLRSQSARAPASADVRVTEQGTPAPAPSPQVLATAIEQARPRVVAPAPAEMKVAASVAKETSPATGGLAAATPAARAYAEAPPAAQAADQEQPGDQKFDAALGVYRAGRFDDAARAFDALGATEPNAPDLWAARAIRDGKGCGAAVARFDKTAQRHKQTPAGWDALLEGGLCYRALGDFGTARTRLSSLSGVDSHKDRAHAELERIDELQQAQAAGAGADEALPAKAAQRSRPATRAAGAAAGAAAPPAAAPGNATEAPSSSR